MAVAEVTWMVTTTSTRTVYDAVTGGFNDLLRLAGELGNVIAFREEAGWIIRRLEGMR